MAFRAKKRIITFLFMVGKTTQFFDICRKFENFVEGRFGKIYTV